MQHQQTCQMATDKIILPDEGGIGCNCKCKGTESIQKRCPLPPRLWLDAFSLRKLIHNSQLPLPCRIGNPHRFRAGGKIRSGPQVGKLATSPLPYRGSPPLQSGGQNQKWPTSGQSGYLTSAVSGIPTASERGDKIRSGPQAGKVAASPLPYQGSPALQSGGIKSEVAHKWAKWLPHPCRIRDSHRCRAGG